MSSRGVCREAMRQVLGLRPSGVRHCGGVAAASTVGTAPTRRGSGARSSVVGSAQGGLNGAIGCSRGFATTHLAAYLERCGAKWGDVCDVHQVVAAETGRSFSWRVDLPEDRLHSMRRGDPLESPPFEVDGNGSRVRFQLFPLGDDNAASDGACSLWLWSESGADIGPVRLRVGEAAERNGGASEFCRLEDVLRGGADSIEVCLSLDDASETPKAALPAVQQSLQLTGLEHAEWKVFEIQEIIARRDKQLHTSPPFRFHHVLLGDMYLELLPAVPYEEHVMLFFRCRVPTMKMEVTVSVGEAFSKTFIAEGNTSNEESMKKSSCLQVNLEAPGVLAADGSLTVRCALEKVVYTPPSLRDMIPRLDERAQWPKRL
eukprot:TRINITY_DN7486_c0_g1_i1.p1 TRINITY_DN7486_c0_g1~~TRINITY_DN7486_c0_g1_i1.p1  ORF type:complete len:374 (-),score=79.04 TRINITY_DN7486_c0_g1_i1:95-1216(-)